MQKKKTFIRILCIVLAVLLASSVVVGVLSSVNARAVSQSEIDTLENQQSDLQSQQEELQSKLDSLEKDQSSALAKKSVLDEKISLTQQEITSASEQIAAYDQLIKEKKVEVEQKKKEEKAQWALYEERIRAMEENGTVSYFAILFGATSFSDLLARIDFISEIMEYDDQMYKDLISARKATVQAIRETEEAQEGLKAKKEELTKLESDLQKQVSEASKVISDIENNMDKFKREYEEIEKKEAEIQNEIDQKMADLQAQQQAEQEARDATDDGGGGGGGTAVGTGSFIWPSNNSNLVTSLYGTRLHPIYGYYKYHAGIDIGADYGSSILASDSGTVMTKDYDDGGYGNYIMLDHGNGRYTLYAHMSDFAVSDGETVSQGQTIGYVGSTGASTGPHIHFEIYVNYGRVDPLDYFSNYTIY